MFFYILISSLVVSLIGLWSVTIPWWNFAVIAFIVCVWRAKSGWQAFSISFAAIAVLWLATTAYIDELNKSRLSAKVAVIFSLSHPFYLILITSILGGLVAGMAGLSGYLLKRSLSQRRN